MEDTALSKKVENAFAKMSDYIQIGIDNECFINDPNDNKRVVGHYGETHFCAALLFYSTRCGNNDDLYKALDLLKGILAHWDNDEKSKDYHADFNNFALAIIYDRLLLANKADEAERIAKTLLASDDSVNHTVNWLPMRAYANLMRYKITQKEEYINKAIKSLNVVKEAQYEDGLFDDLLPKGESFNLQYCISTAATVQIIYNHFKEYRNRIPIIDIKKTMSTLYSLVLPDGDINYMGRGCNQLFAWGPWKYLISVYNNSDKSNLTLDFLNDRFETLCENENLFLNEYAGKDKVLWWDYHYFTVYMAHFLLWNELSLVSNTVEDVSVLEKPSGSGLTIQKNECFFVVTFNGRKHYLIEKGPSVVAIWSSKYGCIFKCGHAASNGLFSDLNFNPLTAYLNHFGMVEVTQTPKRIKNKYLRKIYKIFSKNDNSIRLRPVFREAHICFRNDKLEITFDFDSITDKGFFIFPSYSDKIKDATQLIIDGNIIPLVNMGTTQTQYGEIQLLSAQLGDAKTCQLVISQ